MQHQPKRLPYGMSLVVCRDAGFWQLFGRLTRTPMWKRMAPHYRRWYASIWKCVVIRHGK